MQLNTEDLQAILDKNEKQFTVDENNNPTNRYIEIKKILKENNKLSNAILKDGTSLVMTLITFSIAEKKYKDELIDLLKFIVKLREFNSFSYMDPDTDDNATSSIIFAGKPEILKIFLHLPNIFYIDSNPNSELTLARINKDLSKAKKEDRRQNLIIMQQDIYARTVSEIETNDNPYLLFRLKQLYQATEVWNKLIQDIKKPPRVSAWIQQGQPALETPKPAPKLGEVKSTTVRETKPDVTKQGNKTQSGPALFDSKQREQYERLQKELADVDEHKKTLEKEALRRRFQIALKFSEDISELHQYLPAVSPNVHSSSADPSSGPR